MSGDEGGGDEATPAAPPPGAQRVVEEDGSTVVSPLHEDVDVVDGDAVPRRIQREQQPGWRSRLRSQAPVLAVCFGMFANSVALMNPVPYAGFMVLHFGLTDDKKKAGWYAGYIMSAFMLGRFASSLYCGRLSDVISRKFVIRLGLLSCVVFQVAFGLAPTYGLALLSRLLMGLFNGMAGAAKAVLPELVPASDQQRAMGLVAAMWNAGQIVGPAVGGVLAENGWPKAFPYLMSNLVGALLAALALVAVERFLPGRTQQASQQAYERVGDQSADDKTRHDDDDAPPRAEARAVVDVRDDRDDRDDDDEEDDDAKPGAKRRRLPREAAAPIAVYSVFSLITIAYDETYPLFLLLPADDGGCSMIAREIGFVMSATAVGNTVLQFTIFPLVANAIGSARLFHLSAAACAGLVLVPPLIAATSRSDGPSSLTWGLLVAHNVVYRFAASAAYTALFCCINNSAPADLRGTVNGLAMTIASLFKAAGPTLGSAAFAWSLANSLPPPFHVRFIFIATALLFALCTAASLVLMGPAYDRPYHTLSSSSSSSGNRKNSRRPPPPMAPAGSLELTSSASQARFTILGGTDDDDDRDRDATREEEEHHHVATVIKIVK